MAARVSTQYSSRGCAVQRRASAIQTVDLWEFDDSTRHLGVACDSGGLLALLHRLSGPSGGTEIGNALAKVAEQGRCHGMAVNSLTSVSLDPCTLLFCVNHNSLTGAAIKKRGTFAVNMLANDQHRLVRQFCANPNDRFANVPSVLHYYRRSRLATKESTAYLDHLRLRHWGKLRRSRAMTVGQPRSKRQERNGRDDRDEE